MQKHIALVIALVLVGAQANAWAQDKDKKSDKKSDKKKVGDEVELEPDPPDPDGLPAGARENPNEPIVIGENDPKTIKKKAPPKGPATYPLALKDRPLTLFANMAEVGIDFPVTTITDHAVASGVLRGAFGVTNEVEIGLHYGFGSIDSDGYLEGKAFSVDAGYKLTDWASVRLSVPVLVDPFALAVTIGAPLRFRVMDKVALEIGGDLVSIKLSKFIPSVGNSIDNSGLVAADMIGTDVPNAEIRVIGGVIYQHTEKLALTAQMGFIDRRGVPGLQDQPVPMYLGAMLTNPMKAGMDYGVRVGFADLGDAGNTLGLSVFAALRI